MYDCEVVGVCILSGDCDGGWHVRGVDVEEKVLPGQILWDVIREALPRLTGAFT